MRGLWVLLVLAACALAAPVLAATVVGTNGADVLTGSSDSDVITGLNGQDEIDAGSGNDVVSGGTGPDTLIGGTGFDELDGDSGPDVLHGGDGGDVLQLDAGNDTAHGNSGSDLVLRGPGNATIEGGAGADVLLGSALDNSVDGGDGDDLIHVAAHTGRASVAGGAGDDVCWVQPNDVVSGCETVVRVVGNGASPTVEVTNGPAQNSEVVASSVALTFTTTNATQVWCVTDAGIRSRCDDGSFTLANLDPGTHALTILAVGANSMVAAAVMRRFVVTAFPDPVFTDYSSPAPDVLQLNGANLAGLDSLRLTTADDQVFAYALTDGRVALAGGMTQSLRVADPALGGETIVRVDGIDEAQVVVSISGSVAVEAAVALSDASSPAASTLVIDGTGLTLVDRIVLVHDGGTLVISMSDPGVTVSDGQVIISGSALDGLRVTEINAIRMVEGGEVVASLAVDITISAADTAPPAIETPADLTLEASAADGAVATFVVPAVDAVDGPLAADCSPGSGSTFPLGATTVTCTAVDSAGNGSEASFLVTVVDTAGPALTVPSPIVADATDPAGVSVAYEASALDAVDGVSPVRCAPASGYMFPVGITSVMCESVDSRGNTSAVTFTVEVRDVVAPTLTLPSSLTYEATSSAGAAASFSASAIDAIDGETAVTCVPTSGSTFPIGDTEVACSADDTAGNTASGAFVVRVQDTTGPALRVPDAVQASATGSDGAIVEFDPSATDLVDGEVPTMCSPASGATFPIGTTAVTCVASDVRGNSSAASFDVRVDDDAPVLSYGGPTDHYVSDPAGGPVHFSVTADDAISGDVAVTCDPPSGSVQPVGPLTVHCTAVDDAGNTGLLDLQFEVHYRDAFVHAESTISEHLPQVWEHRHKINLPMSVVQSRPSPTQLVLRVDDGEGGTQPAVAHGLFGYATADGTIAPIDTSLEARAGGGWAPRGVGYEAVLPATYAGGMSMRLAPSVGGGLLRLSPIGTRGDAPDGQVVQGDHLLYPAVWNDTDVVTTPMGDRVAEYLIVRSDDAPRFYSWFVDHPAGTALRVTDAGLELEAADGSKQLVVPHATAADAAGRLVPAGYDLSTAADGREVLTLTWLDVPDVTDPSDTDTSITYPVAIDPPLLGPQQYAIDNFTGNIKIVTNDGGGVQSSCTAAVLNLEFVGREWTDGDKTHLREIRKGSEANCAIGGPRDGESWYFFGGSHFHWGFSSHQVVTFTDKTGVGPIFGEHDLQHMTYTSPEADGTVNDLTWWRPTGDLVFRLSADRDETLGLLQSVEGTPAKTRAAQIYNPTAVFIDTTPPAVEFSPEEWGDRISPLGREVRLSMPDGDGSGCNGGSITLSRVSAPAQELQVIPISDCGGSTTLPDGMPPGTYALAFSVSDKAGNTTARSKQFTVVDPMPSPDEGETLNGLAAIETDLVDDLPPVNAVLTVADSLGRVSILRNDPVIGMLGLNSTSWNTLEVPNGDYTLTLVLSDGTHLATRHVTVYNDILMGQQRDLSSTSITGGLTSTHVNGNLTLHNVDVSISGLGVDLVMSRTYNSQLPGTGTLGRSGWRAGFEQQLVIGEHGFIRYIDPTGLQFTYVDRGDGTFDRAPGLEADLTVSADGRYSLRANNGVTTTFDARGRWTGTVNPNQNHLTVVRDIAGRVSRIHDDSGLALELGYDGAGRLVTVKNPAQVPVQYVYNAAGDLVAYRDVTGAEWTYHYNAHDNLDWAKSPIAATPARVTYNQDGIDENGNPADGTVKALTDAVGNSTHVEYDFDASTVRVAITPMAGAPSTAPAYLHTISQMGRRTFTITPEPSSETITYVYDEQQRLLWEEESDPKRTTYTYDARGNVLTETVIDTEPPVPADPTRLGALVTTYADYDAFGQPGSVTDPKGNTTRSTYDARGNLRTQRAPGLGLTQYEYDSAGRLTATVDPKDRRTEYVHDAHGWLTRTIHPDLKETSTTYDANGNVLSETDENGATTSYVLDAAGRALSVTDATARTTRSTYDGEGNELTATNGEGGVTRNVYDGNGQLVTSRDPMDRLTSYTYDEYGNQASFTNANNKTWLSTYDAHGSLRTEKDPLNNLTVHDYDGEGRRITTTQPGNAITRYTYDHASNLLTSTDPDGNVTRYQYYPDGSLMREINGEGDVTEFAYDPNGNEATHANPDGTAASSVYDPADQLTDYTHSTGVAESYEYDLRGRQSTVTTPAGTTSYGFDVAGRTTSVTNANDHTTSYEFDDAGRMVSQTNPDGGVVRFAYDDSGEAIGATDARGKVTGIERDLSGRMTRMNHADGTYTTYQYDGAGNLTRSQVNPGSTFAQYTYDAANRMLTARTETGESYVFTYDARGNVDSQVKDFTYKTTYTYTSANRLRTLTNSSRTSTFTYDRAGRLDLRVTPVGTIDYTYVKGKLVKVEDSSSGVTAYGYDSFGRVDSQTTPHGTTSYTYDPVGRVRTISQPDGRVSTYAYDAMNNVTSIETPEGEQTIRYDERERPRSSNNPDGGVSYTYDAEDNVKTASLYGMDYAYDYDSRGRVTSQTMPDGSTSHYEYTEKGYLSKVTHGNGDTTSYGYDNNERMSSVNSSSGYKRSFSYYSSGDLGASSNPDGADKHYSFYSFAHNNSGALHNFYSDDQNFFDQHSYRHGGVYQAQLFVRPRTTATVSQIPLEFRQLVLSCMNPDACSDPSVAAAMRKFQVIDPDYDITAYTDMENRVAQVLWLSAPARYVNTMDPATGRLLSSENRIKGTTSTLQYDAAGNVDDRVIRNASGGLVAHHRFEFDARNRMKRFANSATMSAVDYEYDDQARLTRIGEGNVVTKLRYDLDGRLVHENKGLTEISYAYNPLGLESMSFAKAGEAPETYYYEFDTHGNVVHLVDDAGQIALTYHYDAWGNQRTTGDQQLLAYNRFTYAAQSGAMYVSRMDMYYMGIRWYDPTQQRFISVDPAPADPTKDANTYAYANNNPITYLDETGLTARPVRTLSYTRPAPVATPIPIVPVMAAPTILPNAPREPVAPAPTAAGMSPAETAGEYTGPDEEGADDDGDWEPGTATGVSPRALPAIPAVGAVAVVAATVRLGISASAPAIARMATQGGVLMLRADVGGKIEPTGYGDFNDRGKCWPEGDYRKCQPFKGKWAKRYPHLKSVRFVYDKRDNQLYMTLKKGRGDKAYCGPRVKVLDV